MEWNRFFYPRFELFSIQPTSSLISPWLNICARTLIICIKSYWFVVINFLKKINAQAFLRKFKTI